MSWSKFGSTLVGLAGTLVGFVELLGDAAPPWLRGVAIVLGSLGITTGGIGFRNAIAKNGKKI